MIGYSQCMYGKPIIPCDKQLFETIVGSVAVSTICDNIKRAHERVEHGEITQEQFDDIKTEQKRHLPIFTFQAVFKDGKRSNDNAIPTGNVMYDRDHMTDDPREFFDRVVRPRIAELGILLAHVTPSCSGLRLVFRKPEGMDIAKAQEWIAQQLGTDFDPSTKDLARVSYAVPKKYILYVDDDIFSPTPLEGHEPSRVPSPTVGRGAEMAQENNEGGGERLHFFKGIPFSSIISLYWEKTGGEPLEGERNVKLHKLAANLRAICDNSPKWLLEVMPRMGLGESEMEALVKSACKEPTKGSQIMTRIVDELSREQSEEAAADIENQENTSAPYLWWGKSGRGCLPSALRSSLAGIPVTHYFPVMAAVLPIAATLADQVEVEYCDGQRQRLSLMSIIIGDQASGKSVCKQVVDIWKRPLEREDAEARKIEDEWKQKKKNRKANERCPEDPQVMIRLLPVTVSCSTLLKRFKNSRDHTLYSFGEELDTLRKTNGAGSWSSKYDIYRLGFDHGEWGQDYNSDQAESGTVNVAYNWTMLGTYGALKRCFSKDNVENGLSSRVLVAEMPDNSFAPMPHYGRRTSRDEATILEGVAKLRRATGFVDTPRLRKAIGKWVEEKRVEAMADIDRVKDTYRKRAAVIGFRAGVVCHLLSDNERESNATLQFATAIAELTLRGQMSVFGDALAKQFDEDAPKRTGCNIAIFDRLPEVFAMGDIRQLKHTTCTDASMNMIVSRWVKAGWAEKVDSRNWKKIKK